MKIEEAIVYVLAERNGGLRTENTPKQDTGETETGNSEIDENKEISI